MNTRASVPGLPHSNSARRRVVAGALTALLLLLTLLLRSGGTAEAAGPCDAPVANPVACENSRAGTPSSDWEVTGIGDTSIQGFATSMSINKGQAVSFKVKTSAAYHVDILRLGYYQGLGARKIAANLTPTARSQPACATTSATGLIDCGNWGVSLTWTVPSDAVSGVYIAHLVRNDTGGDSQIPFVVRDDSSTSDVVLQTSDATWQAYNAYGGNSLYGCTVACPAGNPKAYKAAYAVSYNRPFDGSFATDGGHSYFWYAEYQMLRFMERNGYNVSYTSQADVERQGSLLRNHKLFISSGHDEYWSKGQRDNVEAARDAGVNLAFFSGNEVFWKTRWTNSSDGTSTPYRTLVSYKDTHFDAPTDPQAWTGTWRDPRFSPPGDGGRPENSLTGQYFLVNSGTSDIKVPAAYSGLRFWRNTQAASLGAGQTLTLSPGTGTLGYEWDEDEDNGFRPSGMFGLSSTTVSGVEKFSDYGSTVGSGTATHNLTLYRAPSGARVFGAGTVQWAWGLDDTNGWSSPVTRPGNTPTDPNMQQATVNLFADMGAQPATLMSGLLAAGASTDATAPSSAISSPAAGATIQDGTRTTITGTATDGGGGVVAGVEVSTDDGATWHRATGTSGWSYSWVTHGSPTTKIRTRATDDSGNIESPAAGRPINVACACSLFGTATPAGADAGDSSALEVGVKFRSDTAGAISGIRFYKSSANTGTHTGSLWSASGQRLAQATFTNESATGWQSVTFASPVAVSANATYVASYFAPKGHYAADANFFYAPAAVGGTNFDSPPLHALSANGNGANGVYDYAAASTFPTSSYQATNYWVDVSFSPATPPGQVTGVTATAGTGSATVSWTTPSGGGVPSSYVVTPYIGSTAQTATTVSGAPLPTTVTINGLTAGTSYTFRVSAVNGSGTGSASAPSNAVTPTAATTPTAPTAVSATPASSSARVSWTAPANSGGSAITAYTVTPYAGTTALNPTSVAGSATAATVAGLTNGTSYTFKVTATNAVGESPASAASNAVTPQATIFDSATPAIVDSGDTGAVVLGVKFRSDASGSITGVRFYKAAANTGTHVGSLWSSTGTLLASATFTNETASGWQQVTFATPVAITAGTTYIASYRAPNGRYSATSPGFSSAVDNPPLHALANSTSPNGVYAYSSTNSFPTSSFNASNYFVDVTFSAAAAPGQVTGVSATAGAASATVSWSAPTGGGAPTSYVVTPYIGSTAQTAKTVTGTPPATSTTIGGLSAGQSYTFRVAAANAAGTGAASAASNAVTPTGSSAPGAPTAVQAAPATSSARLDWTAPASDGGGSITGYVITPYIGATAQTVTRTTGAGTAATVSGLTNGTDYTFKVAATNAVGDGAASTATAAITPRATIFDFAAPITIDSGDPSSVQLGVKFRSDVAGTITGVRFYKATTNTGTHIGTLWSSDGNQLARATFTGETSSGWQQVLFATPVAITANTTYVAAYLAPNGHYSHTTLGFGSAGIDNGALHALANSTSPNGVYVYSSTTGFPVDSYNASNYFVDVLFAPGA